MLNNNFYTGAFQPVQPFSYDKDMYAETNSPDCISVTQATQATQTSQPAQTTAVIIPITKKECWLESLPNSEDFVSIANTKLQTGIGFGDSGISTEDGQYEIVSQWVRFFNGKPVDAYGAVIEGQEHKIGIGARIVAHISTSKAGINLSDLFAVAAAAEREEVRGSLLFTIQGIYGKGVDTYTPKISKLDTANLQRALESIQSIKTLLHNDSSIKIYPQVVAIRVVEQEKTGNNLDGEKAAGQNVKKQGWVYVGYFDNSGLPNGPTNLMVNNKSEIKGVLQTRSTLNVRSGYPTFPFYKLYAPIDNVAAGESVKVIKSIETGVEKYWALIEY